MTFSQCIPIVLCLLYLSQGIDAGKHEKRLLKHLFGEGSDYDIHERPIENDTGVLDVRFGIILKQIIDVDEKNQLINLNLWTKLRWNAYNLRWNPADFGNITRINVPRDNVWKPDIIMYNSASEEFDQTYATFVVIRHTGDCSNVPPGVFISTCPIDITYFPFDTQKCSLKFGSWTYLAGQMDMVPDTLDGADTSEFVKNGEWDLLGMPVERTLTVYECCPQTYVDMTFTVHIRRRTLYYSFNIVIPCILISMLTLLMFVLPVDAGEKISFGVTILLTLMVFLQLLGESIPATSDAVPILGIYFIVIMLLTSISILFTVVVVNFHFRTPDFYVMPRWVKSCICEWLAGVLCMQRPHSGGKQPSLGSNGKDSQMAALEKTFGPMKLLDQKDVKVDQGYTSSPMRYDAMCILRELNKITFRHQQEDEDNQEISDWKFAAMVLDRLCLVLMSVFTIATTVVVLLLAPNFILP